MDRYPTQYLRFGLFLLLALLTTGFLPLSAQDYYRANITSLLDSLRHQDRLGLRIEGEGFFRDNEYGSKVGEDYTLPGYRLGISLDYNLRTHMPIRLSLGISNLYYLGASRYPAAIAYTDLPYWSNEQGYTALRLKPRFQASIKPHPNWVVILGNLEGGVKHGLIDPLYNPELNLTADWETGIQVKHQSRATRLDFWVDWRSFIFRQDRHQEAFVSGIRWQQLLGKGWSLELQNLSHHRGGIENTQTDTVHSWLTSALGLAYEHRLSRQMSMTHQGFLLYYTQRGDHYPSDRGWGIYWRSQLALNNWRASVDASWGRGMISVFGVPFVQSVDRSLQFRHPSHTMFYVRPTIGYQCMQTDKYSFGASLGAWIHPTLPAKVSPYAEVYLNISPYFRLLP